MSEELKITAANFEDEIRQGVTLVDFWAAWCGPCLMQGPIVTNVADKVAGKAKVGKCNVDEEGTLAMRFGIQSIPTLILFKDGQEIERYIGVQMERSLLDRIESAVASKGN